MDFKEIMDILSEKSTTVWLLAVIVFLFVIIFSYIKTIRELNVRLSIFQSRMKNLKKMGVLDDKDFKDYILEKRWMQKAIEEQYREREAKMYKILRRELSFFDYLKFLLYVKLNDYFANKVYFVERRGLYDDTNFLLIINNKEFSVKEKDVG